jgi:hypothetical protein
MRRPMICLAALGIWIFIAADGLAQEPLPRAPLPRAPLRPTTARTSYSISIGPGQRSITLREGDEKIELLEREEGKDITLKHERLVNGATRRDEYKAPDLDTLKKQSPDAADLYRRAVERVQRPARVQVPNGIAQIGLPFGRSVQPQPGQGNRVLTASVKGQQVRIEDRYGANIVVSITRQVDGEDKVEKFNAPDVATLKKEHPEIAALYQRLTGLN